MRWPLHGILRRTRPGCAARPGSGWRGAFLRRPRFIVAGRCRLGRDSRSRPSSLLFHKPRRRHHARLGRDGWRGPISCAASSRSTSWNALAAAALRGSSQRSIPRTQRERSSSASRCLRAPHPGPRLGPTTTREGRDRRERLHPTPEHDGPRSDGPPPESHPFALAAPPSARVCRPRAAKGAVLSRLRASVLMLLAFGLDARGT